MISIIRTGFSPGMSSGSRVIVALSGEFNEDPIPRRISRMIIIKKIDPEDFEDGVNDMGEREDFELSQEELDELENEIPSEVDKMSMEELGLTEDDLDDLESDDGSDDFSDIDLDAVEQEIPPEVDNIKDEDLEADPELASDEDDDLDDI